MLYHVCYVDSRSIKPNKTDTIYRICMSWSCRQYKYTEQYPLAAYTSSGKMKKIKTTAVILVRIVLIIGASKAAKKSQKRESLFSSTQTPLPYHSCVAQKIRPHRFGGEGVHIGVQFGYTKCSSHICLYSSRYISFSWGGAFKIFASKPFLCCCFRNFSDDFWALDLKRVLRWNFGSFWGRSGNRKTDNNEKKLQIQMFSKDLGC